MLQLPALLLHALTLHLNDEQQGLLLGLPECTWAAMGLEGGGTEKCLLKGKHTLLLLHFLYEE